MTFLVPRIAEKNENLPKLLEASSVELSGLVPTVSESSLQKALSTFGTLEKLLIRINPITRKNNGNGYATYQNEAEAMKAAGQEILRLGSCLVRVIHYPDREYVNSYK